MRKFLFAAAICAICLIPVSAKQDLDSVENKTEVFSTTTEKNEEPKRILELPYLPTEAITPTPTNTCEPIPKPRISDIKDKQENEDDDEQSNEIHSRERRPSLVERLIHHKDFKDDRNNDHEGKDPVPCTCGVFLSGQFKKGSKKQPKGLPVLTQEMDTPFMNNAVGNRQCTNKCLELIIKHLPKSSEIICATVDREHVFKERAYLFIKNHTDKWHGTNLSAGREFCCENNIPYKCPLS
ncbi:uncharacterized protein LOC130898588 [Diorhabda carinulata]|uniref:uncharacterized protein LOC130898588 n=1 Tax=Diorhabda carinulata TaxID=1163345 RepID=UPI0025A012CE|nr:uncharacterized protein LOC130898588 [Diorhabda carinulata]